MIGWSRTIYAGIYPLMIGFNAIPKVAVVPILVLWFGIGFVPAVLTAFLISFFPIVVNVATGLATIEPELEDVLKALGASKLDIMRKVGIPRSLPYFFGSLKVAITLAFVGSVISESVASNNGIGNLMLQAQAQFNVPLIFAGLLALAVLGIVMYCGDGRAGAAHDRLGAALGLRAELISRYSFRLEFCAEGLPRRKCGNAGIRALPSAAVCRYANKVGPGASHGFSARSRDAPVERLSLHAGRIGGDSARNSGSAGERCENARRTREARVSQARAASSDSSRQRELRRVR